MNVDDLLTAALDYVAHGWPVSPLSGKLPALSAASGGQGFKDAVTDPDAVRKIWRAFPGANIGVRTGVISGLAVLDVDPAHDGGLATLTAIEEARGVLPGTAVQVTGSDGIHLLYRHRDGIGNGSNHWGPGLDLSGEGGYIVAPPSLHPVPRLAYYWAIPESWWDVLPLWPDAQLPLARPAAPTVHTGAAPGMPKAQSALAGLVKVVLDACPAHIFATLP